jgi:flagellar export protein FliJ
MNEREPRFEYRLEALAQLRSAEREALKAEALQAANVVEARTREYRSLSEGISRAEASLRDGYRSGASISVDAEMRMRRYISELCERRGIKRRELDEATRLFRRALGELASKRKDAKALERHRERKQRRFEEEQVRRTIKANDELWLCRYRRP